ncbi:unnamed protein product [Vitrella brassicaformis CCMP3155]|uniref:Uncharacterized protein n=1 Tax=Vitrella brassicaformis (strain CCMP3155) TaxID=1169540 RepID=A0A0G4E9E5_VITBC|nr:unnamed protein product [Vitrella brassicaformis CCMP3155]|eukprot:CEL92494.1 unnamed protein product [Vitrella brassicaformis CCMP3155]
MADKGKEASPAQQVSGPADGEPEDTCVDLGDERRPPASEAAAGMQTCLRFLEPLCPSGCGQGDLLHDWLEPPSLDWEDLDLGVSLGPPVSSKKPPKAKPTKVAAGGGGVNRAGLWWGEACGWRACQATCQEKQKTDNNTAPGGGVSFDLCCAGGAPRLQPQVRIAASAIDRALRRKDTHSNGLIRMLESKLRAAHELVEASRERS